MPDWKAHIRSRVTALRLSPAREREIIEELAQHLEDRWQELKALGATPDDAEETARTEFDGARLQMLLGTLRQARWHELPPPGPSRAFSLDSVLIDLRHAMYALRATSSFTICALLVLALGIGATTAIFSVVDAVALRPLPFREPDRLVALGERILSGPSSPGGPTGGEPGPALGANGPTGAMPGAKPAEPDALMQIEPQNYLDWVERQRVFESIAAVDTGGEYTLQRAGTDPLVVVGHRVTASFFEVLRSRPLLGSVFASRDEVTGSDRVVVLSHALWQRELGSDPAAIGRTLPLNGESWTIVAVMPADFVYPPGATQPAEIWTPWAPTLQERTRGGTSRSIYLQSIARLKSEVSLTQAQAQMSQVAATIAAANPDTNQGRGAGIRPLRDHLVGTSTRVWMLMLMAAVGLALLIACANVANLWIARASVQQRDTAVRAALGASRGRLVQRVLIESFVVSAAGTVVGLALAWSFVRVLATVLPDNLARVGAIGIDARVLAVAAIAAVATGLVSGLAPALQGSNPSVSTVINESTRGGSTGRGRRRARAALVVVEVALAVVLLVGASLFMGSFINVMRIDPGFRSDHVLTAQIRVPARPGSPPPDLRPAFANLVAQARRLPGVVNAAAATPAVPLRVGMWISDLRFPGRRIDGDRGVSIKTVTADYHRALGIPLQSGRYFGDDDRDGAGAVAILGDAAARFYFAGEDPVGRTAIIDGVERRIVGVVGNARQASLEVSPHPELYLPMAQGPSRSGFLVLRVSGDANDALPALRTAVAQMLPGLPLRQVARLEDLIAAQAAERRVSMLMFGLFGLLGLVISAVGIFGVIAYLVSQQTREIGIRMALGATRGRIVASVFGHVGRLVVVGLVAGSAAAWSLSNAAGRFLFGLDPRDPRAYVVATITLVAVAFVATLLPARRAASIDPTRLLQGE